MGSIHISLSIILALCATVYAGGRYHSRHRSPRLVYAHCQLGGPQGVMGCVDIRQDVNGGPIQIKVNATNFDTTDPYTEHGMHIHTYGDLSHPMCTHLGAHYNPKNTQHGAPTNSKYRRHVGDLGNISENPDGTVRTIFKDDVASCTGQHSIVGRSFAFHSTRDDLGLGGDAASRINGNAGPIIACCVIGHSDSSHWREEDGPYV